MSAADAEGWHKIANELATERDLQKQRADLAEASAEVMRRLLNNGIRGEANLGPPGPVPVRIISEEAAAVATAFDAGRSMLNELATFKGELLVAVAAKQAAELDTVKMATEALDAISGRGTKTLEAAALRAVVHALRSTLKVARDAIGIGVPSSLRCYARMVGAREARNAEAEARLLEEVIHNIDIALIASAGDH